jgi:hypothetical protein
MARALQRPIILISSFVKRIVHFIAEQRRSVKRCLLVHPTFILGALGLLSITTRVLATTLPNL